MHPRIVGTLQRLDNLEAKARSEPIASDDELKAQIAQFLCVLSSGLIEEAVRSVLSTFGQRQSSPKVAAYVSSRLSEFQNPNFEKILILLAQFDPSWRTHFESLPTNEMKDAINSIVNNRHQIAHGKQVGVSIPTFSQYYSQVKMFLDELDKVVR